MTEYHKDFAFLAAVNVVTALVATGFFFSYDLLNNGETDLATDACLGALVGLLAGPYVAHRIGSR